MARTELGFHAGDRLGKYELVRQIGKGGFASVWLARLAGPHGFEQNFAIKLIRTDLGTDFAFKKMFIDEARLAAMVNHPNVAQIFELGQEREVLYLVMEHVRGRPLNVLRNQAEQEGLEVPVGVYMRILADTCGGLHAAHELTRDGRPLGVIHRDVSPHNILVSDRGIAKLIDFGVAKANDRLAGDTATGLAKGKIRYMAPEQALAKELDRRVDIWSLGAVAYDLIEGHAPFDGPNDVARMYLLLGTKPPPPMTVALPPPIERVIFRALAREPKNRFATAQEMKTAIETALEESSLRVTSDDIAAFFGKWLGGVSLDDEEPSESSYLHERLALAERRSVGTATVDVPAPANVAPPPHRAVVATRELGAESGETLAALDSSIIPGVRPRRRMWVALAAISALVLSAVVGAGRLKLHAEPSAPSVSAPATTSISPPPPVVSFPPPPPPIAVAPDPAPEPPIALDADPTSSSAKPFPHAKPRAPRPPAPHPAPDLRPAAHPAPDLRPAAAKPRAAPSSRPRYDDTIQ